MVFKLVTGGRTSGKVLGKNAGATDGNTQGCALWTSTTRDYPLEGSRNVDVHDETGQFGNGEHYLSSWRLKAFTDAKVSVDDIEVRTSRTKSVCTHSLTHSRARARSMMVSLPAGALLSRRHISSRPRALLLRIRGVLILICILILFLFLFLFLLFFSS